MELPDKLKVLRLLNGLTQAHVAHYLAMKATTHIARWELGESVPRTNKLQLLGSIFQINWPWLQDSSMPISQSPNIYLRPLSPYLRYTARWLLKLKEDLPGLFIKLMDDLDIAEISSYSADCGGGFLVCSKPRLTLFLSAPGILHRSLIKKVPIHHNYKISDPDHLNMHLFTRLSPELCEKYNQEELPVPEQLLDDKISRVLSVRCGATVKIDRDIPLYEDSIRNEIDCALNNIFNKYNIDNLNINVSLTDEHKPSYFNLIEDPFTKELASKYKDKLIPATF